MTDPIPDDLAALARAMGYTVTLDDSGGAGVVRVVIDGGFYGVSSRSVFCPHLDAGQAWEVLCWLLSQDCCNEIDQQVVRYYPLHGRFVEPLCIGHDNTPSDIRRAIVEAAIRVAKG